MPHYFISKVPISDYVIFIKDRQIVSEALFKLNNIYNIDNKKPVSIEIQKNYVTWCWVGVSSFVSFFQQRARHGCGNNYSRRQGDIYFHYDSDNRKCKYAFLTYSPISDVTLGRRFLILRILLLIALLLNMCRWCKINFQRVQ